MKSSLRGRVKNVVLYKANGLLPLFEAVVNSIQAIEDRSRIDSSVRGQVDVYIRRDDSQQQMELGAGRPPERPITSFEISDNGIGFNDDNWASFQELDFTRKADRGCRGIGRLTWLKAFSEVRIESWYDDGGTIKGRWIKFTTNNEDEPIDIPEETPTGEIGSKVYLSDFQTRYAQSVEKTASAIASKLLEHLMWFYVRSTGGPRIILHDDDIDDPLQLAEIFKDVMRSDFKTDDLEVNGKKFNVTHVKFRGKDSRKHVIAYCAGQRLVKEESLDIAGLSNSIFDEHGPFRYAGYVVGDYLDQRVHPERADIDMDEETTGLFASSAVSRSDLRDNLSPLIEGYLGDALAENLTAGRVRLDSYLSDVAPQYMPIVKNLPTDSILVDPAMTDANLDKLLHGKKYEIEQALLEEGEKLLKPDLSETHADYSKRVSSYMAELDQVKQSDLAAYVAHRRVVIDLLRKAMEIREDGKYAREEVLHSLIMPMRTKSEDLESLRGSNLWLIDERLAFHQHYLGSDKSLASIPVTGADGGKEPDLMGLNLYKWVHENPHAFSDTNGMQQPAITIVEIKRPMKGEYRAGEETDPIEQAYGYLRRIRKGGVMDKTGRHIPNAADIPAHVYVIADLTSSLILRCESATLKPAPDGMSYFGYNDNKTIQAYIEVIDFGKLLANAKQRNSAFFERLGLPSSR